MAKKRRPSWQRGAPRPPTGEPKPIETGASGTADVDFSPSRTVESTWDPSRAQRANFSPIAPPAARHRRLPLNPGWISVIIAAALALGGIVAYVGGMRADIAVAGARIDALQKSNDSAAAEFRAEIRRVETVLEGKLSRLSEIVYGRRERDQTAPTK